MKANQISDSYVIIKNAKVFGGGSVIVVKNGRIIAVGGEDLERAYSKESNVKILDLNGKYLFPGFIDSHMHFSEYASYLDAVDLRCAKSIEDVKRLIENAGKRLGKGDWVIAFGWNEGDFQERRVLNKQDLHFNFPVVAFRRCMHIAVVNDAALSQIDIKEVSGGEIDVENGILKENALSLIHQKLRSVLLNKFKKNAKKAGEILKSMGLTTVSDMGIDADHLEAYWEIAEELPIRVVAYISPDVLSKFSVKDIMERNSEKFIVRGIKLYVDGSLGGRTAALYEDYSDDPGNKGMLIEPQERLIEKAVKAASLGLDVAIHAIGDKAFSIALAIAKEVKKYGVRVRIEHCQVIKENDLKKAKDLEIILCIQPIFINTDSQWAESRLGKHRVKNSYMLKSLINFGFIVAGGSDAPVEPPNPLYGIYAAIYRKPLSEDRVFRPEESVDLKTAVKLFTENAAYALGIENIVGKIYPGYRAEFVIFNKDPTTVGEQIKDMCVHALIL